MSPLRAFRELLGQIPQFKDLATQAKFAACIGRSESLIRGVENGRVPMSARLAREISAHFNVPLEWFMKDQVSESDIAPIEQLLREQLEGIADQLKRTTSSIPEAFEIPTSRRVIKESIEKKRYAYLRARMIDDVLKGIYDQLRVCSDNEFGECLEELRSWTYSRLKKMADLEGATENSSHENAAGLDG